MFFFIYLFILEREKAHAGEEEGEGERTSSRFLTEHGAPPELDTMTLISPPKLKPRVRGLTCHSGTSKYGFKWDYNLKNAYVTQIKQKRRKNMHKKRDFPLLQRRYHYY